MKKILNAICAVAAGLLMSQAAVAQEKSKLDEVLARGKVIVGVSSESPPFGFINEKGDHVGFDIDVAKLIAKGLFGSDDPKHIEFVKQSSAARWENVNSGKVDFGIHVATVLPDRVARVAFTRGYIDSSIVVIVKADSKFKKFSDLNTEKVTTAILSTPVQADRANQFFPKAKTTTLDSIGAQFTAVKGGRVDAAQLDEPVALWYASQNKDVRVLEERMTAVTNNAIYMKQGDFKWWLALDTYVNEMRAGSMFNDYAASYKTWFGKAPLNAKYYVGNK
ncbi:transporter substrate-binding domain-containing protein [Simplicispira suum]|uniref:Murein transglycosylase n=1 Tax=Simplicispira suum TaxID=2109915 RepID=A0A2S0N2L1_9BURK|nr:transporter substrate-binding domain-containing protein [Simplicispira suum]AVO42380.1 murein transglycosylase [Simplicispira suum]